MIAKAHARFLRISPRKLRQVVDVVRGKNIHQALSILANLNKRAALLAEDILRSAMNNAKSDPNIKDESLYISKMIVDSGPTLKRFRAASMGRASMIRHRTSHMTVELDLAPVKEVKAKKAETGKGIKSKIKRKKRS